MNALQFFAVCGFFLFKTPWVSLAGAVVVAALHFWTGASWWWMAVPSTPFVLWAVIWFALNRR